MSRFNLKRMFDFEDVKILVLSNDRLKRNISEMKHIKIDKETILY